MRKFLAGIFLVMLSSNSLAQHGHYRPHYHVYNDKDWIAPLIIGGFMGAIIARETQRPPVIVQQPLPPNAVIIDGRVYSKQIVLVDGIYREVLVRQ